MNGEAARLTVRDAYQHRSNRHYYRNPSAAVFENVRGTMPTNLTAALLRKESERCCAQADLSMLLVCLILCLINLCLILASPTIADAFALLGTL
jgi:hypothetical protein